MTDTEPDWIVPPSGEAQALIDNTLLNEILDDIECDAMEYAIAAQYPNDEQRRVGTMRVRAVRELRQELETRAAGQAKPGARAGAP